MILCANCQHTNLVGAAFCSDCGAPLEDIDAFMSHDIGGTPAVVCEPAEASATASQTAVDNWVALHLLDTGQVLPLSEQRQFTLGRRSDGQPVVPDIDLTPYQAYDSGVSRLHAVIRRGFDQVYLMDLGSANGTFVNGKRLDADAELPLANGDVVALGRLKIQILLSTLSQKGKP